MSAPEETRLESFLSRFSKPLLWMLALLLLPMSFYAFVNARGALAWRAMKKQLVAAGHLTDYSQIVPAPVPDEQNFFKAPIAQAWFPVTKDNDLRKANFPQFPLNYPPLKNQEYSLVDLKLLPKTSPLVDPGQPSRDGLVAWFGAWERQLDELYVAALLPKARLDGALRNPSEVNMESSDRFLPLARFLASKVKIEALTGNPQRAERDLAILKSLLRPLDALAISGGTVIRAVVGGTYANTLHELLAERLLAESGLAEVSEQLRGMDVFTSAWRSLHETDRLGGYYEYDTLQAPNSFLNAVSHPVEAGNEIVQVLSNVGNQPQAGINLLLGLGAMPSGWIQQKKVTLTRGYLLFYDVFDPKARVVNVRARQTTDKFLLTISTAKASLQTLLLSALFDGSGQRLQVAAFNQVKIDEALVACALERYRLAKGNYPRALAELTPKYLEKRPHDLFTGKDFIYRSESTNSFKLYSVGYNGVDDGGKEGIKPGDKEAADWVW